jgi:hypothetical protein
VTTPRAGHIAALCAATAVLGSLAIVGVLAAPARASGIDLHRSAKTTIVKGVQRWSIWWNNDHGYQHGYVMSVDLTVRGLSIRPAIGHGMVNERETTRSMATRTGAIGGVNGDLFDWGTSLPWGGVAINGVVFKHPPRNRVSQFYLTKDGRAGIGALDWTGTLTLLDPSGKPGVSRSFFAVNAPLRADAGRISLFTPAITSEKLNRCAAVVGTLSGHTMTVTRTYAHVGWFSQLSAGHRMLAACGTAGGWLLQHAPRNQRLRLTQTLTTTSGTRVTSFISGQRALRLGGKAYRDLRGFHTNGINPETAVCVSGDGLHVRFVTVDGWLSWTGGGNGITLGELGQLAKALRCYSATVLDGGGSTTMVERRNGTEHVVNRVPTWYGQRPVANAVFVFKS